MKIEQEYSLKYYNTFGINVKARYFIDINNEVDFSELCASRFLAHNNIFIIGSGSNVLFSDYFDGSIIKINIDDISIINEDKETVTVRCGAGCLWDDLVRYCVNHNLYGLENLALIPGTVGAAPVQNIGAYGVEQKDFFYRVEAINLETQSKFTFKADKCKFEYRNSIFKNNLKNKIIISYVEYKLFKSPMFNLGYKDLSSLLSNYEQLNGKIVYDTVCKIRQNKLPDPKVLGNAGSFFKNPIITQAQLDKILSNPDIDSESFPYFENRSNEYKISAAYLIEACGWKGKRYKNCGVYEKHSLILVNYGGSKGYDIINLAEQIEDSVLQKFDIKLEREVLVI